MGAEQRGRADAEPAADRPDNNEYSLWPSPDGADWTYIRRPEVP